MSEYKPVFGTCQGCMSSETDMKSMLEPYEENEHKQTYVDLFSDCFKLEVGSTSMLAQEMPLICSFCIQRLQEAWTFRQLVSSTQEKLKKIKFEPVIADFDEDNNSISDDNLGDVYIEPTFKLEQSLLNNIQETCDTKFKHTKNTKQRRKIGKKYKKERKKKKEMTKEAVNKIDKNAKDCNVCQKEFTSHKMLIQHMAEHYPNYICNICGRTFLTNSNLNGHLKRHSEDNVECDICHRLLKKSSLRQHLAQHDDEKKMTISCMECGDKFLSRNARKVHLRDVHKHSFSTYRCEICLKDYASKSVLKSHKESVHEKKVNQMCNICNKGFFNKYKLDNHMLKHTGIREFSCQICSKAFLKKYTLQEHMKIHNNVRNYVCSICRKAFTYKCSLKGHINTHHPDSKLKLE